MTEDPVLHLGKGLDLPAHEFVESKSAIMGASGGGKSGALKVIMEELVRCRLPFAEFDLAGNGWGIKSSLDGKGQGLKVLVVGGEHADVALNTAKGADWARAVVETNCQVIFDLSEESTGAYQRFLTDFADEFYRAQGKSKTPRLVIIDEAHEILPQDVRKSESVAYGAVKKLITRGRNRGIGVCLVSQRPAGIAKAVLTQCGSLFIFGLLGTPDRKAIGDWVEAFGEQDKLDAFNDGVASLAPQECWFWSPREFRMFLRARIRNFRTFHPDYTHLRKMGLLQVEPVTANVEDLITWFSAQMERVREEKVDAAQAPRLRQELAVAQRRIKELEARRPEPDAATKKEVERLLGMVDQLRADLGLEQVWRRDTLAALKQKARASAAGAVELEAAVLAAARSPSSADKYAIVVGGPPASKTDHVALPLAEALVRATAEVQEGGELEGRPLKKGARRMLAELAARGSAGLSRAQLGTLAGFAPAGGTFKDYVSALKARELIEDVGADGLRATAQGVQVAEGTPRLPQTTDEVLSLWIPKMKSGAGQMLRIVASRPTGISREELGRLAEFAHDGGTFKDYLSVLRRNGLVETDGDVVRPAPALLL